MFKTKERIKQDLIQSVRTGMGANDVTPGSVLDVLLDAIAEQQYEQIYDIYSLSQSRKLENMSTEQLDLEGRKLGLIRQGAKSAAGKILIHFDHGFELAEDVSGNNAVQVGDTDLYTTKLKLNKLGDLHVFTSNGNANSDSLIILYPKKLVEGTPDIHEVVETASVDGVHFVTISGSVSQKYLKGTKLLVSSLSMKDACKSKNYGETPVALDQKTEVSSASTGTTQSLKFKLAQPVKLSKKIIITQSFR